MGQATSIERLSEAIIVNMTLIFGIRCIERVTSHHWVMDDSTMAVAVAVVICAAALGFPLSSHGLGRDASEVTASDVSMVRLLIFCAELLYGAAITIIRCSYLFFYLRVFPQKPFKVYVYSIMAFTAVYGVVYDIAFAFQCWPVDSAWTATNMADATCVDIHKLALSGSIMNMLQDLMVVLLPTPILWKLSLPPSRKIQVFFMFSLGIVVTIISSIRIKSIATFKVTHNPTYDYVEIWCWSAAEVFAGIVCSCLPSARRLFRKVFSAAKAEISSHHENSHSIRMTGIRIESPERARMKSDGGLVRSPSAGEQRLSDQESCNDSEIKFHVAKDVV